MSYIFLRLINAQSFDYELVNKDEFCTLNSTPTLPLYFY